MDKKTLDGLATGTTKLVLEHNQKSLPNSKFEDIVKLLGPYAKQLTITKEVNDEKTVKNTDGSIVETGRVVLEHGDLKAYIPTEGEIEFGADYTVKRKVEEEIVETQKFWLKITQEHFDLIPELKDKGYEIGQRVEVAESVHEAIAAAIQKKAAAGKAAQQEALKTGEPSAEVTPEANDKKEIPAVSEEKVSEDKADVEPVADVNPAAEVEKAPEAPVGKNADDLMGGAAAKPVVDENVEALRKDRNNAKKGSEKKK